MSLTESDRKLRVARDIVDRAHELSAAVAAVELLQAKGEDPAAAGRGAATDRWSFEIARMRSADAALSGSLKAAGREQSANDLGRLYIVYETSLTPVPDAALAADAARSAVPPGQALAEWVDRLLKVTRPSSARCTTRSRSCSPIRCSRPRPSRRRRTSPSTR